MPYEVGNPPDRIKGLPSHAQEIWIKAFNSALEQYKDEGKANAVAWAAVKKAGYNKNAEGEWVKMSLEKDIITIEDIEIFETGTHNGDTYTLEDLEDMVNNFHLLQGQLTPPFKLGHDRKQKLIQNDGYPAAGWVSSLKLAGNRLIATFSNVPRYIADLMKKGAYRKFSSEIFWDYKDKQGKVYRRVLAGVAALGADIAALDWLNSAKDWATLYEQIYPDGDLHFAVYNMGGENNMTEENPKLKEYEDEIAKLKAELQGKVGEVAEKEGELKTLSNSLDETNLKLVKVAEKQKRGEIKLYIKDMKMKGKILPKHEALAEAILSSEDKIKYYSADKKEVEKPVSEVFKEYLDTLPKLVEFNELSQNVEPEEGSENEMDMHDKIIVFCKEHKEYSSDNPDHYLKVYGIIAMQEAQKEEVK